jgi:hypothetical protein
VSVTEPMAARGSDADYCERWPDDGHAMESQKPAHTTIWVRRCASCGWIDGADLERQRDEAVVEGRRQVAEEMADLRDTGHLARWRHERHWEDTPGQTAPEPAVHLERLADGADNG